MPKLLSYHTNGTGRDSYISFDNGGNYTARRSEKIDNERTVRLGKTLSRPDSAH